MCYQLGMGLLETITLTEEDEQGRFAGLGEHAVGAVHEPLGDVDGVRSPAARGFVGAVSVGGWQFPQQGHLCQTDSTHKLTSRV